MRLPSNAAALVQPAQRAATAFALSTLLVVPTLTPLPALADGDTEKFKFPPIDRSKKDRCAWVSSAMGQANAARDSLYDLRECSMVKTTAAGFDISGALLANGDFSNVDFKEAQLSKVYALGAKFDGADFTNGILDRGFYKDASFKGAIFTNAVRARACQRSAANAKLPSGRAGLLSTDMPCHARLRHSLGHLA